MTIADSLAYARDFLSIRLEAELLLSHASRLHRESMIAHPERKLNKKVVQSYKRSVQRRAQGEPIAYITGYKEFFGFDFYVDNRVFIPRPETELLVEAVGYLLSQYSLFKSNPLILDIGTGSGCIAIALAKHLPNARLIGVDISEEALEVARKNAKLHAVTNCVKFIKSDLLSEVGDISFDIIVANLPYGGSVENHLFAKEVTDFEPHTALFGGATGFELFEKLFEQIARLTRMPHFLVAEIGFSQYKGISMLIEKYFGNAAVIWKNDLAGFDRAFVLDFSSLCLKN